MKDLKLTIRIKKPAKEVFEFTSDPANTPLWIDGIVREVADTTPVQIGTNYKNWDKSGQTNEYVVTRYEPFLVFQ